MLSIEKKNNSITRAMRLTYFWLPFPTSTSITEVLSCHYFYKQPRFRELVVTSVAIT